MVCAGSFVCVICCKSVEFKTFVELDEEAPLKTSFSLLLRQLQIQKDISKFPSDVLFCPDCYNLLEEYGERYQEWKRSELQVYRSIDKISDIMRLADRVPSRVNSFRKKYYGEKDEGVEHDLVLFRTQLKKECKLFRLKCMPRVYLRETDIKPEVSNEDHDDQVKIEIDDDQTPLFYGWLSSLVAVIMLSDLQHVFVAVEEINTVCLQMIDHDWFGDTSTSIDENETLKAFDYAASSGKTEPECNTMNEGDAIPETTDSIAIQENSNAPVQTIPETEETLLVPVFGATEPEAQLECQPAPTSIVEPQTQLSIPDQVVTEPNCSIPISIVEEENNRNDSSSLIVQSGSRRKLRTVHRCRKCWASFSSIIKLDEHAKACQCDSDNPSDSDESSSASEDWKCDSESSESENDHVESEQVPKTKVVLEKSNDIVGETTSHMSGATANNCLKGPPVPRKLYSSTKATKLIKSSKLRARMSNTCGICKKHFDSKNSLAFHHHSFRINGYKTPTSTCLVISFPEEGLTIDDYLNPIKTKFSCRCQMGFTEKEDLESHQRLHGHFKCSKCQVSRTNAVQMAIHYFMVHRLADSSCKMCYQIKSKSEFISHYIRNHLGLVPDTFHCPICKLPVVHFNGNSTMNVTNVKTISGHYRHFHDTAKDHEVFTCTWFQCKAYFLQSYQLKKHLSVVHGEPSKEEDLQPKIKIEPMQPRCRKRDTIVSHSEQGLTIDDYLNPKKTPFACNSPSCKMGFREKAEFKSHRKLHRKFKCSFCKHTESFAVDMAIHELIQHSRSKTPTGNVKCPRQCKKFVSCPKSVYVEHFVRDHLNLKLDKFNCPICGFSILRMKGRKWLQYETVPAIARHYKAYHDTTQGSVFNCGKENCKAYFLNKLQQMRHMESAHEDLRKCDDCGKVFKTAYVLRNHRTNFHKISDEDFKFFCDKDGCSAGFENEIELELHIAKHDHGGRDNIAKMTTEDRIQCSFANCDKTFHTMYSLRRHLKTHKKNSNVCKICKKEFATKSCLKQHMVYHEDPNNWKFSCSVCGKKSSTKSSMEEHMRSHSSVKSFVCQECGQAYAHRHNLRNHLKSKHGIVEPVKKRNRVHRESTLKGKKFKREKLVKI